MSARSATTGPSALRADVDEHAGALGQDHRPQPRRGQPQGDPAGRAVLVEGQLGVHVQIAAELDQFRLAPGEERVEFSQQITPAHYLPSHPRQRSESSTHRATAQDHAIHEAASKKATAAPMGRSGCARATPVRTEKPPTWKGAGQWSWGRRHADDDIDFIPPARQLADIYAKCFVAHAPLLCLLTLSDQRR